MVDSTGRFGLVAVLSLVADAFFALWVTVAPLAVSTDIVDVTAGTLTILLSGVSSI